jgi:hypothetical protein
MAMDPLDRLRDAERALLAPAPVPDAVVPMAATLVDRRFGSRSRETARVEPRPVAQVGFTDWTRDRRPGHQRLAGPRDDGEAREVVRA